MLYVFMKNLITNNVENTFIILVSGGNIDMNAHFSE